MIERTVKPATKTIRIWTVLLSTMLWCCSATSTTKAQQVDGDFDELPVGTAPDDDMPAGAWHFPQNYIDNGRSEGRCTGIFTIVPTDSIGEGGVGNSLCLDSDDIKQPHVTNLLNSVVTTDLIFRIETYVPTGGGNGSFYLSGDHGGGGFSHLSDRGPQVSCFADGTIVAANPEGDPVVVGHFDFDQWLQFELHISLEDDEYDIYYGPRDGELNLLASDMGFRSGPLEFFDRVSLVYFGDAPFIDAAHQYFDNLELAFPQLVERDDEVFGDGSITLDRISGKEWLDVTLSQGRSYLDVAGQTGSGGDFEGFRHATEAELLELFEHAGVCVNIDIYDDRCCSAVGELIGLVGSTYSGLSYGTYWGTNGFLSDTRGVADRLIGHLVCSDFNYCAASTSDARDETAEYEDAGHWLVRRTLQTIVPNELVVLHGEHLSGDLSDLDEDDGSVLSLRSMVASGQSRTEFILKSTSTTESPHRFEFTLESVVSIRQIRSAQVSVVQSIELYDYQDHLWVPVDIRPAAHSRAPDLVVNVSAKGDLARFVEPGTRQIESRITYESTSARQKFVANIDQAVWMIE